MKKNLTCLHDECFKTWYFHRNYLQKVVFSTIISRALKKAEAHNELYLAKNSHTQNTAGNERAQPLLSLRGGPECGGFGETDGPDVSRSSPRTGFIHPGPGLAMCASPGCHLAQRSEKRQEVCPLAS